MARVQLTLASSAGDPVEDGGSSRELQPNGAPGRKNVQGGVVFIHQGAAGGAALITRPQRSPS